MRKDCFVIETPRLRSHSHVSPSESSLFLRLAHLLLWAILLLPPSAHGQADTNAFAWVRGGGGPLTDSGTGVAVDANTNAVIAGLFNGIAQFGSNQITSKGLSDIFVCKYSSEGALIWAKGWGGSLEDAATATAVDTNGNVFITGFYRGDVSLGGKALTPSPGNSLNAFIAKLNSSGDVQWARGIGNSGDDRGFGVTTDLEGNSYVSGSFQSTVSFGSGVSLTSTNTQVPEGFLASYTPSGDARWAKRLGASNGAVGYAVTTDPLGHVLVVGEFVGIATIDDITFQSSGDRDIFIASFDATTGNKVWAIRHGQGLADGARCVGADPLGNVYVGGYFNTSIDFGTQTLTSQGRKDFFIAKFDPTGKPLWARSGGSQLDDGLLGLTVSRLGSVTAVGNFIGTIAMGNAQISSAGTGSDAFVFRLDPDGAAKGLSRAGGSGAAVDSANAVASHARGHVFIAGDFSDVGTFGTNTLNSGSVTNRDFFVARKFTVPPSISLPPQSTNVILGKGFSMSVVASGEGPFLYQWLKQGIPILGETNATFLRTNTVTADMDAYSVEVSNTGATITSDPADLNLFVTLTTSARGRGQIAVDPIQDLYPLNSQVTLLALPAEDAFFFGWAGDISGQDNPLSLTLNQHQTNYAVFGSRTLQLGTIGQGSISALPTKDLYNAGDRVDLTAVPAKYYAFVGWSDGVSSEQRSISIGLSNQFTAVFTNLVPVETLTIGERSRTAPVGMPSLTVDDVFVITGPETRGDQAVLKLSTTFTNGILVYSLDGKDPNLFYEGPITINSPVTVRAWAFSEDQAQLVELDPIEVRVYKTFLFTAITPGAGQIFLAPLKDRYFSNEVVTVTAVASNGWNFIGWHGDFTGTNETLKVNVTENLCVEGIFGTPVILTNSGGGILDAEGGLPLYPYASKIRITATAPEGSNFVSWSGAVATSLNPLDYQITRPAPVFRALFLTNGTGFPLSMRVNGEGTVIVFPRKSVYASGESVLLVASPATGEGFIGWSGYTNLTTNRISLKFSGAMRLEASFTQTVKSEWITCSGDSAWENVRLTLRSRIGAGMAVDRGNTLGPWTPWLTLTNTLGSLILRDLSIGPATGESRFYRIRSP